MTSTLYSVTFEGGTFLRCPCDHHPKMAEVSTEGLSIKDGSHRISMPARDLVELLSGTKGDGAVAYVVGLFGG